MRRLFSRRAAPRPDQLRYDVPEEVRRRIFIGILQLSDQHASTFRFPDMLHAVGEILMAEYGDLDSPAYRAARVSDDPVIQHFFSCDDIKALDFIEACFHAFHNPGQAGVELINQVFDDAGIGYELTPYIETVTDRPGSFMGREMGKAVEIQHPEIIRKESQHLHAEAVKPTIELLKDRHFKGANEEFLKAHEHYRHGDYKACLVECLKAFESTMKIICHAKSWPYNQTDTAKTLIQVCLDKSLIPTFSQQQMTSLRTLLESGIPTVRNNRGGHGQGVLSIDVAPEVARYALHLTAATLLLLIESAKII